MWFYQLVFVKLVEAERALRREWENLMDARVLDRSARRDRG